ncbi:hypothetical protein GIB67_029385 [Kingdonia uniflora]|uniref:Uncharacterized protein n=1 Tax=Kingdonia uniflora TaxID=39325 RepID=A0A7J7NXR2_9MAGN|nr:hypothetical protein GIB67_029385 [Kingdonia uniflora]
MNLSCIKVAVEFVSPESINECIRLTEEYRALPQNHLAKEDKLEVVLGYSIKLLKFHQMMRMFT